MSRPSLLRKTLLAKPLVAALGGLAAGSVCSQPAAPGWLHLGAAYVDFDASATVKVPALGGTVPGQSAQASNNTTLGLEVGWRVLPDVIVSATVGLPPTTTLKGDGGPFDGATLGRVKYGPAVLSAHYHWNLGGWQPYVGGGLTYVLALESRDATLTKLDVPNALGGALQVGVDVPLGERWGLFVDVKKLYVKAKARFEGPAPGTASVTLDPLIVHAGVSWSF